MQNHQKNKAILIKHLVEVEENSKNLIDDLYPSLSKKRAETVTLLENYLSALENLVLNFDNYNIHEGLPFVIIGSLVKVSDLSSTIKYNLRIISPFNGIIKVDDVSFLSPVGRALLLKTIDQQITVTIPAGICDYKILSIKPDFQLIASSFYPYR